MQDYSVNMYFRQSWIDPRLMFNQDDLPKQKQIRLGQNRYSGKDGVWVPDTFFRNEKKAQYHSITVDNKMMKLSANGKCVVCNQVSAHNI